MLLPVYRLRAMRTCTRAYREIPKCTVIQQVCALQRPFWTVRPVQTKRHVEHYGWINSKSKPTLGVFTKLLQLRFIKNSKVGGHIHQTVENMGKSGQKCVKIALKNRVEIRCFTNSSHQFCPIFTTPTHFTLLKPFPPVFGHTRLRVRPETFAFRVRGRSLLTRPFTKNHP